MPIPLRQVTVLCLSFTGRLTQPMFDGIWARALALGADVPR